MAINHDHGGDLTRAVALYGGNTSDWIDLSTGINRTSYNTDNIGENSLRSLPDNVARSDLLHAAQSAFQTDWPIATTAGAQTAIQLLPRLLRPGKARILGPTYNEFERAFESNDWQVELVEKPSDLRGAKAAVVVNPNNPTGTILATDQLVEIASTVDLLVVDESFADAIPKTSLLPLKLPENVLVLRSFGKFFGLAGLRLGFALGSHEMVNQIAEAAGPWPVSGPALEVGKRAYADTHWQSAMRDQLAQDAARCDALAKSANWKTVGGTALFRTYETTNAQAAQNHLASHRIWSRIFPYSKTWIRLGLPGSEAEWCRLEAALRHG